MLVCLGAKMVVYVEYVLISNFIIDFLILKATFFSVAKKVKVKRIVLVSVFASVLSLVFPIITVNKVVGFCLRLCSGILIVLISSDYKTVKSFYVTTLVFFCYTFLFGGSVYALTNSLNYKIDTQLKTLLVVLPVFLVYLLGKSIFRYILTSTQESKYFYDVEVCVGSVCKRLVAFLDTGNGLSDGEYPVIICSKSIAKEFFKQTPFPALKHLYVSTVNGTDKKIAFTNTKICLINKDMQNIYNNVTMCVTDSGFSSNYQVIISPRLLKGLMEGNDEASSSNIKKIS